MSSSMHADSMLFVFSKMNALSVVRVTYVNKYTLSLGMLVLARVCVILCKYAIMIVCAFPISHTQPSVGDLLHMLILLSTTLPPITLGLILGDVHSGFPFTQ